MLKERTTVLSINSNQRRFFTDVPLTDPETYRDYLDPDIYDQFAALYNQAKEISQQLNIQTYQEYAAENNIDLAGLTINPRCRELLRVSRERQTRNGGVISLLNPVADDVPAQSDLESLVNRLNAYVMSAPAHNYSEFWRPFLLIRGTNARVQARCRTYNEQHPDKYTVELPTVLKHIKAIKLASTEIPNVINNITSRNNIITIKLRTKETDQDPSVPLAIDLTRSIFDFVLVKIPVGCYTLETLATAMQDSINETCYNVLVPPLVGNYQNLFTVSIDQQNGKVSIVCNNQALEFHLKFYSQLAEQTDIPLNNPNGKSIGMIRDYTGDLWYMLGFPWPYQITVTGDDRYVGAIDNMVNHGIHSILGPESRTFGNDIFDRGSDVNADQLETVYQTRSNLNDSAYQYFNSYRVHRFPQIDTRYIYLVLKGLPAIQHVTQYNGVANHHRSDIFAKIQLDTRKGKIAYNTFVCSPLVFANPLDKLDRLEVEWVDERGLPVDFGGVDHSFTLEIVQYFTQLDTAEYDTGLGGVDMRSYPGAVIANWPPFGVQPS